ncbi:guanine-specific ribonuclease N1 and T1 [Pseudarthrobacter chlorophenolicus A6]|uniref:Guanine-specific ribonuclease N1 and T1 n=1 Tax=Pseudarthrobacter chlorophenolicus (strain ATCC 700700 / DSM 12829 / CIP 107037 / JCM 12360 / KCTC 9906 / NCIMB 13794 / A6) TaxID=452863 RepID=B8HCS0_PSECP|nr:ribonuclease domain-containing protein [Pseudarthrobacter chlorophenolicus]ACL38853.1 guanine-specific ribonuclease N1 and T1 [Pseudarthrobacter chlorophenolicus A6]SDR07864.1 ribonuclease T1 [Pseudarthrobacter chlorophenolicus]
MRNRNILPLLLAALVVVAVLVFGGQGVLGQLTEGTTTAPATGAAASASASPAQSRPAQAAPAPAQKNPSGLPAIRESQLPAEGRRILALIRAGGPYRYSQDDQAFGNFEGILPRRDRGYYREYTVPTPGESDRGARRIVAGADGDKYYTGDHYESFSFITEGS